MNPFPSPNRTLRGLLRVVLWLLPACLVFTTFHALDWLVPKVGGPLLFWLVGWLSVNVTATCALGVIEQQLTGPMPAPGDDAFVEEVAAFVGLQVILVTGLMVALWLIRGLLG